MADTAFKVKNGLVVNTSLLVADPSTSRIGIMTASPTVTFDIGNATDAIKVPVGNTSQRSSGANGHFRYNNQTNNFEGFSNGAWGSIAGTGSVTPGSNTQIEFNDSGVDGASAGFTFNKTTNAVSIANSIAIGTATINSTNFGIAGLLGNTTAIQIASGPIINSTAEVIGNTVITSGTITLGAGATVNTTVYTGSVSNSLTANNSTNLNGQAASYYLAFGNFSGTISAVQMGTTLSVQLGTLGVGVAAPGSNALYVYGIIYSYSSISTAGNVVSNSSDRRLKHKIEKLSGALTKIKSLTGITYEFNDVARSLGHKDFSRQVGLFADDVERIQPEIVPLSPLDTDVEGNSISGENYKTVMYERLVPLLVEAIKELAAEVESLKVQGARYG